MSNIVEQAKKKLKKELESFKGGQKEKLINEHIHNALIEFCVQDVEFAEAIVQNDSTLSDCCKKIIAGVGNCISDIEAYKRAVDFYFPGAGVSFEMKIDTCAAVNGDSNHRKILDISLDDLLSI